MHSNVFLAFHVCTEFGEELLTAVIARRRRIVTAGVAGFLSGETQTSGQGPQGSKERFDDPFSWAAHLKRLTEKEFKLRYRVSTKRFDKLLGWLRPKLEVRNEEQARKAKWGELISSEAKLAICLRYLAGGDPKDLKLIYHVGVDYIYKTVWRVVDAINYHPELAFSFPIDDVEKLSVLEAGFRQRSRKGVWRGQVAALDGVNFKMLAPTAKDVPDPLRYYVTRKAEYCLLCMALCDAERRFLYFDISQGPNTHDSLAWALSDLGIRVKRGDLPAPFFINSDSAFVPTESMATPSGRTDMDDYDFEQSSNRIPIECAFGILIHRWGVLWKPLKCGFERRVPLISACMRLHNFCIDARMEDEWDRAKSMDENGLTKVQPGRWEKTPIFNRDGRPIEYMDIEKETRDIRRDTIQSGAERLRNRLVQAVRDAGLARPALSKGIQKKVKRARGRGRGRAGRGKKRGT